MNRNLDNLQQLVAYMLDDACIDDLTTEQIDDLIDDLIETADELDLTDEEIADRLTLVRDCEGNIQIQL